MSNRAASSETTARPREQHERTAASWVDEDALARWLSDRTEQTRDDKAERTSGRETKPR
ncbi:MAG: hypothetical protein ACK4N5_08440 [Myxococcales bacterium]